MDSVYFVIYGKMKKVTLSTPANARSGTIERSDEEHAQRTSKIIGRRNARFRRVWRRTSWPFLSEWHDDNSIWPGRQPTGSKILLFLR
jgi:hypothetical protein